MNKTAVAQQAETASFLPSAHAILQRKCDCGNRTMTGGECEECGKKKQTLQRKVADRSGVSEVPLIMPEVPSTRGQPFGSATCMFVEPRFGQDLSKVRVSPAQPGVVQAHLVLGQPGDRFEREADLVADSIMQFPIARSGRSQPLPVSIGFESLHRASDESASNAPTDGADQTTDIAKATADGEETEGSPEYVAALLLETDDLEADSGAQAPEEQSTTPRLSPTEARDEATMQARELPGQTPKVLSSNLASRIDALRSGGQPLSTSSRDFFEPRFGHDLSRVRVHTGAEADQLARSVQARAFTIGRDVVFGEGHYQPASPTGQWLMAHELTHVLQQQEGLSRSPAQGIQVQHTGRPQLQGGFWGKVWGGIKKGTRAVWGGIKKGASAAWGGIKWTAGKGWSGIKWMAGKVWSGIKWTAGKGWNVLKSAAALAWSVIVNTPERVWRLIKHLGSGIAGIGSWLWEGLKLAWHLDFKGMGKWLLDGILSGSAWVGRLIGKLVDIAGIGEVWDLLFQIIKFNTRTLTSGETSEAKKTFKSSISYWQVRVDELSLIAHIGAAFEGGGNMGVTTFHTINFNRKIEAMPGSPDMHWLTHELTHVSQYEHAGSQYLGEAIHAQATAGYDYNGPSRPLWRPSTNVSPNPSGKHFRQFNREQQADIAADYYYSLYNKTVTAPSGTTFTPITSDYEPVVDELRAGDM
ncbi:DUF4157 domain-containing protein [Nitrosovibrio sp. Nv6]|uniref:eCIS core domain-containing protein n=1 Tax=Nitrosovibrio sp. Nv6 TaxID=1855340 RepID=UPI0008B5CDFF|nr:DUF4157 domain-containing protein [Nitrosovibrio sp. Nv6]SEO73327.1 protein of unknown function [Nitrosovibrio sp. Nv6]